MSIDKETIERLAKKHLEIWLATENVFAIEALEAFTRALLKEVSEQEPVAYIDDYGNMERNLSQWMIDEPNVNWKPLYTTPPNAQAEIDNLKHDLDSYSTEANSQANEIVEQAREIERLEGVIERLGSSEAMTTTFIMDGKFKEGKELVARLNYARDALATIKEK